MLKFIKFNKNKNKTDFKNRRNYLVYRYIRRYRRLLIFRAIYNFIINLVYILIFCLPYLLSILVENYIIPLSDLYESKLKWHTTSRINVD